MLLFMELFVKLLFVAYHTKIIIINLTYEKYYEIKIYHQFCHKKPNVPTHNLP
jgi:hypothetical protein